MTAGWYWTRATWRRAARGAAVLALLVALGVGGAIGAAAGARRTATAYDRLAARSNPPQAFVFSQDSGVFDRIARRPEVAAATGYVQLGLQPAGVPCSDRPADYYQVLVPAAGAPFTVPKPRLLEGRYADPSAPDEAVVSEQHARRLRIGVGDTIRYLPYDVADGGDIVGCLKTTVAKVRVVGVIRELFEIGAGDEPTVAATYLTPAFRRDHPDAPAITGVNGFARLKAGTNVDRFAADVAATAPRDDNGDPMAGAVTIQASRPMGPALDALAFGLWVLAGAMAAAAAVAVTVAIVRQVAATGPDLRLLSALGLSRRQAAVAVAAPMLVALCVGLGLAVVVAAAVSTVHLIGVAAAAEPDPGLALDAPLLLAGLSIAALAGLAVIALATWRGAARALDQPENDTAGRHGVVDRSLRQRLPPWAAMGSSYALGPGRRGAASVPARAVALAVGAATAGLVAVLVFGVGVTHAKGDPSVYGFGTWDGFASNADEESDVDVAPIAAADPDVATVARLSVRFKLPIGGTTISGFAVENVEGQTGPTVVTGRLPAGAGEIALGKDTAALLRAGVGSAVSAEGPKGSHRLRVVGIAAFPNIDSDALATGWVADRAAIDALGWPPGCNDESECFNTVAFSWRPGSDAGRATRRLHDGGVEIEPAHPGREVIPGGGRGASAGVRRRRPWPGGGPEPGPHPVGHRDPPAPGAGSGAGDRVRPAPGCRRDSGRVRRAGGGWRRGRRGSRAGRRPLGVASRRPVHRHRAGAPVDCRPGRAGGGRRPHPVVGAGRRPRPPGRPQLAGRWSAQRRVSRTTPSP